jgi:hypothetical protein
MSRRIAHPLVVREGAGLGRRLRHKPSSMPGIKKSALGFEAAFECHCWGALTGGRVLIKGLARLRARHGSLSVAMQTILFNEGATRFGSQSLFSSFNLAWHGGSPVWAHYQRSSAIAPIITSLLLSVSLPAVRGVGKRAARSSTHIHPRYSW